MPIIRPVSSLRSSLDALKKWVFEQNLVTYIHKSNENSIDRNDELFDVIHQVHYRVSLAVYFNLFLVVTATTPSWVEFKSLIEIWHKCIPNKKSSCKSKMIWKWLSEQYLLLLLLYELVCCNVFLDLHNCRFDFQWFLLLLLLYC